MSVSLLEVSLAARARAVTLTAESAGYLILAVIDAGGLRQCTMTSEMVLLESGEIRLGAASMSDSPAAPERALRTQLGQLLALCSVAHPALAEVSRSDRQGSLSRELEAALIPVNRAAGRRTLARACRDTERAKRAGKLNDAANLEPARAVVPAASPMPAAPAPGAPINGAPRAERRRQPRTVAATTNPPPSPPPRIVEVPAVAEPQFTSVEHTVRIDQLRSGASEGVEPARKTRNATVADRRREPRATGRRLDDVRASLEQQGKTPFLGSVVTELREAALEHDTQIDPEVLPVEPIESPVAASAAAAVDAAAPQEPVPLAAVVEPDTAQLGEAHADVVTSDPAGDLPPPRPVVLDHTPPWQPNVAALPQAMLRRRDEVSAPSIVDPIGDEPVVDEPSAEFATQAVSEEAVEEIAERPSEDAPEPSPLEEAEGFFLLLDEAGSSKPPTVATVEHVQVIELAQSRDVQIAQDDAELAQEMFATDVQDESELPPEESELPPEELVSAPVASKAPLYQPQRSDLAALFAELEQPRFEQDLGHELKLMAGIEASASSQTPPPVGFSEVNDPVPAPADPSDDKPGVNRVLARAKGVGLATLTGLGVALLLLRAPQTAPPVERASASGVPARCTASVQVVDAPHDAEIRVRAPAPNTRFSPLAAHGSAALFPQLPCGTSLEVMVRDSANPEASWAVIPIAPDELTARTGQVPLRISARPEDRINP
jgi:hypothetical protein